VAVYDSPQSSYGRSGFDEHDGCRRGATVVHPESSAFDEEPSGDVQATLRLSLEEMDSRG
jgi:hypothetical protein